MTWVTNVVCQCDGLVLVEAGSQKKPGHFRGQLLQRRTTPQSFGWSRTYLFCSFLRGHGALFSLLVCSLPSSLSPPHSLFPTLSLGLVLPSTTRPSKPSKVPAYHLMFYDSNKLLSKPFPKPPSYKEKKGEKKGARGLTLSITLFYMKLNTPSSPRSSAGLYRLDFAS